MKDGPPAPPRTTGVLPCDYRMKGGNREADAGAAAYTGNRIR
jgi:hypothetical protein